MPDLSHSSPNDGQGFAASTSTSVDGRGDASTLQEALSDFDTHRETWRKAIQQCAENAIDGDEALYWQHELRAFDRAYAAAKLVAAELVAARASTPVADVPMQWPKEKRVGRMEDMSPDGMLEVGLDNDNDVYVVVSSGRLEDWCTASVEFCNGGGGGGSSLKTRRALIELMRAIEEDNAASPHKIPPRYRAVPAAPSATPESTK